MTDSVRLLDCTLRDGGYLVDTQFGDDFIRGFIRNLTDAGLDVIEVGFLKDIPHEPGSTIFNNAAQIAPYLPAQRNPEVSYVTLADYGRYDVSQLEPCDGTSIDGVRACFFRKDRKAVLEFCRQIQARGYLLYVQPVDILGYSDEELLDLIRDVNELQPFMIRALESCMHETYMDCPYHSDFSRYSAEMFHSSVYFGKLGNWLCGRTDMRCDSLGWGMDYSLARKPEDINHNNSITTVRRHTAETWDYLGENCFYVDRIAAYCRSRDIRLVLITTPTWHTYYEHLDRKQLNRMYEVVHTIPDAEYYDYLKDGRFVEDDFYDADHLSDVGAKKFTLILRDEVLNRR